MAECRKCGLAIRFGRRVFEGVEKWVPVNPDLTDHWDTCKGATRDAEWTARAIERGNRGRSVTGLHVKHVWSGEVPPWDFSLGDFRDFTAAEKAEGLVCRRL